MTIVAGMSSFSGLLPAWIRTYRRRVLFDDVLAGVLVAVLVLPQSLAYALLAGLPPQAGLYASILPAIAYAWVGSSMVQAVGPVAITAIMTFSVLQPVATPGTDRYGEMAACLALMSGAFLVIGGALRLGFLSQLLSRPVVQGFISGSAVLILLNQSRHLLGVDLSGMRPSDPIAASSLVARACLEPAAWIGLGSLATLVLARAGLKDLLTRLGVPLPICSFAVRLSPLLVVVAATLLVLAFDLDKRGVRVVGPIEAGLPGIHWKVPEAEVISRLAVPALLLSLVGMVQNIALAQALAIQRRERVAPNRELLGLGGANLAAFFFGGMPVGGGVSRSVVNVAAGAQSPLATIISAAVIAGLVAGAGSAFSRLPLPALAASIIVAAVSIVDLRSLREAWSYDRADALAWLGTASGVVILGLERGVEIGIALSLATLLIRAGNPHIASLGRIPGTQSFRNIERHEVETLPGVLILRIDESLFFGNRVAVEERIAAELAARPAARDLVLMMGAVNRIDTTALEMLSEINRDLGERGVRLHLAEIKGPIQDRLSKTQLWSSLTGIVFLSVNDAYDTLAAEARTRASTPKQ